MTKRDFQKMEYDREHLEKDTVYVSRRETIEDSISVSLTKKQWWAIINHILNDLSYSTSGYSEDIIDNAGTIINEIRTSAKLECKGII